MAESDLIVNHQKYYNKLVQMGNQQIQSSNHTKHIINKIHEGIMEMYIMRLPYNNNRVLIK